ncbi:MAG: deoxyribose-phosphate aldolase, partial [Bdellovibrionales bacterium CG22_combo_CG10-13_8_21_14_all_38_13]
FETTDAIKNGATEIDMVISIGNLISGNDSIVVEDIKAVVKAAGRTPVKVILETALLTQPQIAKACQLCTDAKASFVKTSTGFSTRGASIDDIVIMKANISSEMKIKASGGIRSKEDALKYIDAGVDRLGTSAGKEIMKGSVSKKDY